MSAVQTSSSVSQHVRYWSVAFSSHARDTGKRLPGLSVGPPRSVWAVGCLLMSAIMSSRRCARLHDETRLEIQASFCSHDPSMQSVLDSLAESDYCWLLLHSVSAEIRILIYGIRRYASAVNEYSPIYDIGLTLARANGAGAHFCSYNTHHRRNQPHQAFTCKHSPDGMARVRKQTSDYSLLLNLSTSKGWKAELTRVGWLHTEMMCCLRESNPDTWVMSPIPVLTGLDVE